MVKYLLNFLFVFLCYHHFLLPKHDDSKLQKEYGSDLTKAPFFLRFAFHKEFNKDWKKSDYSERKAFLTDYETNLAEEQAKKKQMLKLKLQKEKERFS